MLTNFAGILFDGIAYGSLLFLIGIGLSVTMGLMNFINLAHGAFAMLGGYVCVVAMTRLGLPFLASLPVAFIVTALAGVILERTLYQRLYRAGQLDQVLFSIGLTFMAIAAATYFWGPSQQPVQLPEFLRGQVRVLGLDLGAYRLFLVALVIVITVSLVLVGRAHALRCTGTRRGRQSAGRGRNGHSRQQDLRADIRARLRSCRTRRRARHRRARARSDVSRSNTWCTSCWSFLSVAPAASRAR